jgi:DNA-binding PadR family transcriptional regulator
MRHARFGGEWFGPPFARGRRARRGDVRAALLALLAEQPMHGYDLIRELEGRSGGMWRPSPGSIYPTLQMLEDEGLVTAEEQDGKRVYSLTDAGRAEVDARREHGGSEPWEFGGGSEGLVQLRDAAFQLAAAAMQVARAGAEAQMKKAAEILAEARKKIYALLAEG